MRGALRDGESYGTPVVLHRLLVPLDEVRSLLRGGCGRDEQARIAAESVNPRLQIGRGVIESLRRDTRDTAEHRGTHFCYQFFAGVGLTGKCVELLDSLASDARDVSSGMRQLME